jgi:HEAT repeat protein
MLKDLAAQFRRDAFAARAACDKAVQAGPVAVPAMAEIAQDAAAPDFARMWAAAALAGIGDPAAADVLAHLVDSPSDGVRDVVAYRGAKLKDKTLQQAILARAEGGQDPVFTAWTARGFQEAGRDNERLIAAAVTSTEPRARAEVADAVAARAGQGATVSIAWLSGLLQDQNELVRVAAATSVGTRRLKHDTLIGALIRSLDRSGTAGRQKACWALSQIVGNDWTFEADDLPQKQDAIIGRWKNWFAARPLQ